MLSAALSIGATGLRSMQAVADLHSGNIANAETPGYRRRDSVLSEMVNGGVSQSVNHRFSEVTATRISQLAGAAESSAVLTQSLNSAQSQLGEASAQLSEAQNALRTALGTAAFQPSNATARTVAGEKAAALARIADTHLQELNTRIGDEATAQAQVRGQAASKLDELAALNRAVVQSGSTPELKDKQAQAGRELAELVGGEVTFTASGLVEFTVSGTKVLSVDGKQDLPEQLGGQAGGHATAQVEVMKLRDAFASGLEAFAEEMNSLNSQGIDGAGRPGGELFALDEDGFSFTGQAQSFAFGVAAGTDGSIADKMSKVGALSLMTGEVAAQAASRTSLARAVSDVDGMALGSMEQRYQTESGVDVDYELIGLKNAQRAYEANAKVIQTADAMLGTLLSIKA